MARATVAAAALAVVLCAVLIGTVVGEEASTDKQLQAMRRLVVNGGGVAQLDDSNFQRFALAKARPYQLIVLLTARDPVYRCSVCSGMEDEFRVLADSYQRMRAENPEVTELQFVVVDYHNSDKTFKKLGVKTVPLAIYFPESDKYSPALKVKKIIKSDKVYLSDDFTAEGLGNWVRGHTHVDIEIYRSPLPMLFMLTLFLTVSGLALKFFHKELLAFAVAVRDNRRLWFVGSVVVYFVAVSGIVFDIIRQPMPFYMDNNGNLGFFHPSSNQQFVVEGLIIGGMNLVCAAAIIGLVFYIPQWRDKSKQQIGIIVCMVAFFFTYAQIIFLYRGKNQWYFR